MNVPNLASRHHPILRSCSGGGSEAGLAATSSFGSAVRLQPVPAAAARLAPTVSAWRQSRLEVPSFVTLLFPPFGDAECIICPAANMCVRQPYASYAAALSTF